MRTIVLASLLLAACSSTPLSPHKIDIQQGNFVNQEMVSKLQPGMTKAQVRFVLGTPLVNDAFHSDRWDYVYRYQRAGEMVEQRRISAIFEGDKLEKVEGDVVPATGLASEAAGANARATGVARAGDSGPTAGESGARSRAPVESGPASAGKPGIPGDVGDSQSAETAPKGKPIPVKRQAVKEEKGVTGKLLDFIGFGDDESEGRAEGPPKPTVERLKGPAVVRVQAGETTRAADAGSDTKNTETKTSETKTIASGIEEDGKLRNREGKTIGEQLEDKFGFASGLASDRPAGQDGQAGAGGEATAAKGDGKWRNREGKTIMEQVREKFGFGDDETEVEAEQVSAETEDTEAQAGTPRNKEAAARSEDSGFFDWRNREGKTVMEQLREKLSLEGPDEEAKEPARSETVSKSREPELKTGDGTISADNYKPDTGSGKSLTDKVLDIFGFD